MQGSLAFADDQDAAVFASLQGREPDRQDGSPTAEGQHVGGDTAAQRERHPASESTPDANQTQWQQRMMVCSCQGFCRDLN